MVLSPRKKQVTDTLSRRWKLCWRNWAKPTVKRSLVHSSRHFDHHALYQAWKELINLDCGMHRPGHNHFPFLLQVTVQCSASHALDADSANGRGPHGFRFLA